MKYVYLLAFCISLFSCASVEKIETLNRSIAKPEFASLESGEVEPLPSGRDYKERLVNKNNPNFSLLWKEIPEGIQPQDLVLVETRIIQHHSLFGNFKKAPKNIPDGFYESSDVDIVLNLSAKMKDNRLQVDVHYKDPVLGISFGQTLFVFTEERLDPSKTKNSVDVFHSKQLLVPLGNDVSSYFSELSAPKEDEVKEILNSSLFGSISVFSSTPGTSIYLDETEIGKAPLINFKLINGKHKIGFSKPGKDRIIRNILVRAGKTNRVFQEWNDDISQGTVVVTSFPSGLDLYINDQKKGATQYAEAGVPYGSYPVRLVRTKESRKFEYSKFSVQIRPKKITQVAFPFALEDGIGWEAEEFWNLTTKSPNFNASFPGKLNFNKSSNLPAGWYGVYSEDLIPERMNCEVNFGLEKELNGGLGIFFTDQKNHSILVFVDKNDFHTVSYSAPEKEAPVRSSYRWKKNDPEDGRKIFIETDPEKKIIRLKFGNKLVEEIPWEFDGFWNLAVLTPAESPLTGPPLRTLKIKYPDIISFEERLKK